MVGLWRWLVAPDGLVHAETALEQVDHPRALQLPPRDLQGVVGEREQPEAMVAEARRRAAGTSGWGGMVANQSMSLAKPSAALIVMPRVAAGAELRTRSAPPMSVNGT